MPDTCHMCANYSYANCDSCGQPTCRRHGREVGDRFVCFSCINEFGEGGDECLDDPP